MQPAFIELVVFVEVRPDDAEVTSHQAPKRVVRATGIWVSKARPGALEQLGVPK